MTARIEYAPGEAWCIAAGRAVLVCERDLPAVRARALHDAAAVVDSVETLRTILELEPAALLGLVDLDDGRVLLRRHGVPATADEEPLDDRFGPAWALDDADAPSIIAAGALDALTVDVLPLESGVARVAAVRVAPRPAPEAVERAPEAPRPAATTNPIGGLIDSVPGFIRPAVDLRAAEPAAAGPSPEAPAPAAAGPSPEAPAPADAGDHDGMTVNASQARGLQEQRAASERADAPAAVPFAPATGPLVLSTLCPNGHVNAPGTSACARCGSAIDDGSAAQRPRPEVAVAVLPSGERVPLGRGVVLGRRPRSRRAEDGRVPRLVTVESPGEDISRSHLELRVDDWNLIAIDLSSTNGTLLLRDGAAPQRLRPEASTILQLGDRLDLGDDVVVTIEAAP